MDLLAGDYDDGPSDNLENESSSGQHRSAAPRLLHPSAAVKAAPLIASSNSSSLAGFSPSVTTLALQAMQSGQLTANLPAAAMLAISEGPRNPYAPKQLATDGSKTLAGSLASDSIDPAIFSQQYNTYAAFGYAADPSGSGALVGDARRYAQHAGASTLDRPAAKAASAEGSAGGGAQKRARLHNDDSSSDSYLGPWAGYSGEQAGKTSALERGEVTLAQKLIRVDQGLNPDGPGKLEGEELQAARQRIQAEVNKQKAKDSKVAAGAGAGAGSSKSAGAGAAAKAAGAGAGSSPSLSAAADKKAAAAAATTTFHGKEEVDYQGRAWIEPPKGVRPDGGDHECYVPKRQIHKWTGHSKGVNSIGFFPGTGHLLLSASLDGKCKVWEVGTTAATRQVKRTYAGHSQGVRQATFSLEGLSFASVSYDKHVMVWDTETGAIKNDLAIGATPYCATWRPGDPNQVFIGAANRKVIQYDLRSNEVAIEYEHHLGAVNTITFYEEGKKFFSCGDDKKILVWEMDTPTPIKYIADPSLHAINAVAVHPSDQYWVGQSMDNALYGYTCGDKVAQLHKKIFKGHVTAGYACQPSFSPDGHFLGSGDGEGTAWFWDWRSGRVLSKLKCHDDGPCIGMAWHPLQPSWVATCGWDGLIKLWD